MYCGLLSLVPPPLKIVLAASVFLLFLFLRRLFARLFIYLFDKMDGKIRSYIGSEITVVLEPPLRLFIVIAGVWIASIILGFSGSTKKYIDVALHSMTAFLLFWIAFRFTGIITSFMQKYIVKSGSNTDSSIFKLINNGLRVVIVILCTAVILKDWGYDIAALLTGLGLGGLAFALAARDTLANLFGGIVIMIDRPFNIGDWVITPHAEGIVEEIGFRSTRIRTFEQTLVTIPNSLLGSEAVTNWSRTDKRRISLSLNLAIEVIQKTQECISILRKTLKEHPAACPETVLVHLEKFDDKSMQVMIQLYVNTTDWQEFLKVREDINFKLITVLQETGIFATKSTEAVNTQTHPTAPSLASQER